jgi:hypothetical protein
MYPRASGSHGEFPSHVYADLYTFPYVRIVSFMFSMLQPFVSNTDTYSKPLQFLLILCTFGCRRSLIRLYEEYSA